MSWAEKTFKRGEVIMKEGDVGQSFFKLLDGKAGVYADYTKKNPFRLGFLNAGEFFGEMAILEASPRSATVVAESAVRYQTWPRPRRRQELFQGESRSDNRAYEAPWKQDPGNGI